MDPKFNPKNCEKYPQNSQICICLRSIWKILNLAGNIYTDTVCDKYEVCSGPTCTRKDAAEGRGFPSCTKYYSVIITVYAIRKASSCITAPPPSNICLNTMPYG